MPRRRTGLATRIALVTTLAAAIAVLIAGLVSARVISRAAETTGHKVLEQYANLSVAAADLSRTGRVAVPAKIIALLRTQQVQLLVVQPDGRVTGPEGAVTANGIVTPAEVADLKAGNNFSDLRRLGSGRYYLEGRPITTGTAAGGGVVLGGASEGLRAVVELLSAPVVTTREGKGAIDDRNPLSVGTAMMLEGLMSRWIMPF